MHAAAKTARHVGFVSPIVVLFCLASAFRSSLVAGQENKGVEAKNLVKQASERIKLKQYGEALDILNAAIEAYSGLSEAYLQRAFVLRHLCRFEESENNYRKVLELKSGTSSAEKELSQLSQAKNALDSAHNLLESGDFSKALEYIDKVVLIFSPGCLKAKLLKVKLLLALKDYSSAISETGYLLKEDENNLDALLLRGLAYYYLADHEIASRHYQKGLRLDPEHGELKKAYFALKNLLKKTKIAEDNAEKGKLRASVEDFKAALAMDPNHTAHNVNLYLGLCKVLVKLGRGNDAVNTCTEALNIDEELVEALTERGEAKLIVEDWEGALEDLKTAAQKSPEDRNIREALHRAEKALKLSKRKDWYKILEISKTASIAEIKRAYKKLALQWHPDKNVENREEAAAKFQEIAAAYEPNRGQDYRFLYSWQFLLGGFARVAAAMPDLNKLSVLKVLGDDDKRARYDRGEDLENMGMGGGGGGGFNPFGDGGGGQQFTFQFEGGFPGGGNGFPGGFGFNF